MKGKRFDVKQFLGKNSVPVLFIIICAVLIPVSGLPVSYILNEAMTRLGRNAFLILSLLIPIMAGMGLNFAMTLGAMAGEIALILVADWQIWGIPGLVLAAILSIPLSILLGLMCGSILNRAKGREMVTSYFIAYCMTGVYQLIVLYMMGPIIPILHNTLKLPRGFGIRNTVSLLQMRQSVDNALAVYVGGVLGRLDIGKGYVVEGCRNEAPVTLATAQAANNLLGGIAAYANGENRDTPNTIRNCENRGDVLADAPVSDKAKTGQARMGGICGGTAVFEGNTNYGKVEARGGGKGASEFSIGGISGMIAHDATGCRNFGDVLNNTGRENLLAHTGGLFGWATLAFTITDCALDADVVSTTLYNYDGDKGTTADPAHENSSCAGILVGRIKSKIEVTVESVKIYGKLTRTINAEGQTRTIDFTTTVPADNYLYGALQDAASKLVVGQGAITCVSTAK